MKRILLCTGEDCCFDSKMTMFKSNNQDYQIDYVKMFSSEKKIDRIKRNLGKIFIKKQISKDLKKDLSKYDCAIFFEAIVKNHAIEYLRKNNPNLRIIIYFRNMFSFSKKRNVSIEFLKKLNCEFWSYNEKDCEKYGFKYNSQFWNTTFYEHIDFNRKKIQDMIFLGRVKNRGEEIIQLHEFSTKNNLIDYIYLVPKSEFEFDKNINDEYMNYIDYLNKILESKAIVDLVSEDNYGLTIRPLEATFLKKKLITNYKNIKNYEFYNRNNVFILGEDNLETLNSFLEKEFEEIDFCLIEKYDFKNWIRNFLIEE